MPPVGARNEAAEVLADPEVRLSLTGRSGPLVVEIEYRVDAGKRPRLPQCDAGSAAQPPAQRRLWLVDRARHRRSRIVDRALSLPDLAGLSAPAQPRHAVRSASCISSAIDFHLGPEPIRVRRMLERPFGSVRWKEDTPDRAANEVLPGRDRCGKRVAY